jgi:hypothetical protein
MFYIWQDRPPENDGQVVGKIVKRQKVLSFESIWQYLQPVNQEIKNMWSNFTGVWWVYTGNLFLYTGFLRHLDFLEYRWILKLIVDNASSAHS